MPYSTSYNVFEYSFLLFSGDTTGSRRVVYRALPLIKFYCVGENKEIDEAALFDLGFCPSPNI